MQFIRYKPYTLFDRSQREFNTQTFWDPFAGAAIGEDLPDYHVNAWQPEVDIKEEADRYIIQTDLPGVDAKDIDITLKNDVLTLKGERSLEKHEEREGYKRVERARGTFYRRFSLPDTANADKIEAKSKDGVLTIELPKHEKVQPRRISVKS